VRIDKYNNLSASNFEACIYHYTKSNSCSSVGCPEATGRLRQKDREQKRGESHRDAKTGEKDKRRDLNAKTPKEKP
jgi:hypothetical protein